MSFDNSLVLEEEEQKSSQNLFNHTHQPHQHYNMHDRESMDVSDVGNEGNKSTYLRPSRNRDMSSLDIKANSRSCSNVMLKETSRIIESEDR